MTLSTQVNKDYLAAYKAKDMVKVAVLRLLKTAFTNFEKDAGRPVEDKDVLDLIIKQAKQRRDSIEQYSKAGREELAENERKELEILNSYLPAALTPEELAALVDSVIAETGATSMKDMGRVMSAVMAAAKGRAEGGAVSGLVRARLGS